MKNRNYGKMSDIYSFHPESVSIEELRAQLKLRLPTVDLDQMGRDQLVKIFKSYAMPIHQRSRHAHTSNDTDQNNQHVGSQRTIHLKRKPDSSVEKLTDSYQKIKFSGTREEEAPTAKKRLHDEDTLMTCDKSPIQSKRKKITWP